MNMGRRSYATALLCRCPREPARGAEDIRLPGRRTVPNDDDDPSRVAYPHYVNLGLDERKVPAREPTYYSTRSKIVAMPWPMPMHIVARP